MQPKDSQTTERPKSMKWDERDNIILKLLGYANHTCQEVCTCGLRGVIERCEELGYGG